MSYAQWRQQVRLLLALQLLALSKSVTQVAMELGYESPSAIISMFRKTLGTTPSRYFS
jgi:AraC-like DNA-binding protein